jgi:hypothetical protein
LPVEIMLPSEQKLSTQTNIRTRRKFYSAKCQTIYSRHPGYISFSIQLSRRICCPGKANPVTFFFIFPQDRLAYLHTERGPTYQAREHARKVIKQ